MTYPDIASLFSPPPKGPSQDLRYRQGRVVAWNPLTAQNIIEVGGTELVDLPILNTTEALIIAPGDTVGLAVIGTEGGARTMAILGRWTIPNTPGAASALSAVGIYTAEIAATETTTSVAYTDLATVGPVVANIPVGGSGRCLVFFSAVLNPTTNDGASMSCDVAGATTVAAPAGQPLSRLQADASQLSFMATRVSVISGLNLGYHTFTAKYRSTFGAAASIGQRVLIVVPF
jgi:hypothetical protein